MNTSISKCLLNRILILLSVALITTNTVHTQIIGTNLLNETVFQYEKIEWDIILKAEWKNPYAYTEVALDLSITTPTGKKLMMPCYYESGESSEQSIWKARFAARETGLYTYHFILKRHEKVISTSSKADFQVNSSSKKGFLNYNNFWTLRYDNGELFRGIGENICWESRDEDDSKYFKALHEDKRFNYPYMLNKLAQNGGNFFRVWMIYFNLPVDWKTVKNNSRYKSSTSPYNESGMKRMDQLVELCDSLGIHMMVALESHAGFLGKGWQINNYNITNGGAAKTPTEFFTLPDAKQQYKNKLRLMVARYGYSPSIAAWEFFNEVDNAMYNVKPVDMIDESIVTAWHDEMSSYLKTIDPYNHLITTSISHRNVVGLNDIKNMDINQRHIYKNVKDIPEIIRAYTQKHQKP